MIIILTGAALNGKRFTFCQIFAFVNFLYSEVIHNGKYAKGTRYDVRNSPGNCWYYSDNDQHYCYSDQHSTIQRETKTSKKQPHQPKVMVAFLISNY